MSGVFHDIFDQTWPVVLLSYAAAAELVLLPFTLSFTGALRRRENLKPKVIEVFDTISRSEEALQHERWRKELNLTPEQLTNRFEVAVQERVHQIYSENKCSDWRLIPAPFLTLAVPLFSTYGLKHMCGTLGALRAEDKPLMTAPSIEFQDFLWIPDLSAPDPMFILPCLVLIGGMCHLELSRATFTNLANFGQAGSSMLIGPQLLQFCTNYSTVALAGILALAAVSTTQPACVSIYWCCALYIALLRRLFLMSRLPLVWFRLPKLQHRKPRPLKDFAEIIVSDIKFLPKLIKRQWK